MEILAGQSKAGPRPYRTFQPSQANDCPDAVSQGNQTNDKVTISGALLAAGGTAAISLTDFSKVDKFKHMSVTAAATVAFGSMGFSPAASATLAWAGGTVGKEIIYDLLLGGGTPSVHDAVANLAGAFAGYAALKTAEGMRQGDGLVGPSLDPAQSIQTHEAQQLSLSSTPNKVPEK